MSQICFLADHTITRQVIPVIYYRCKNMYAHYRLVWTVLSKPGIACWLKCQTGGQKVASLNPVRSGRRIFFSRVNFVCWLLFGVRSTPVFRQWHVKDPGHSAKSSGGRLFLNILTPLTQRSQTGLTMLLCQYSVGSYQEISSRATCQGILGHGHLSLLSHCRLILA